VNNLEEEGTREGGREEGRERGREGGHLQGMHLARRQSIMALYTSSLFLIEKFMKLVSTKTRKGGPREVLY